MVALVIMDGVANDVDLTIEKLVQFGTLPLSIIIAGVGPADFSCMVGDFCTKLSIISKKAELKQILFNDWLFTSLDLKTVRRGL